MTDETVTTDDEVEATEEGEGPAQRVVRMPDDSVEAGPKFPSGMNSVEAALSGATAGMSDEQIALVKGEQPERRDDTADDTEATTGDTSV